LQACGCRIRWVNKPLIYKDAIWSEPWVCGLLISIRSQVCSGYIAMSDNPQ
jgi:hypothetical protein